MAETKKASKKATRQKSSPKGLQLQRPRLGVQDVQVERDQVKQAAEEFFSGMFLQHVLAAAPGKYRSRILSIEVVLLAMLNFVLSVNLPSLLQLVDRMHKGDVPGLKAIQVSPSAFYKRIRTVSHEVFLELLRQTTKTLSQTRRYKRDWILTLAPFANGIYAIDDTTLDALIRRTKALKEYPKGAVETLGGRLGCALDLITGAYAEILYDSDAAANEKNHIRPLIERLGTGNMYVFDLGYFAFEFFDYLTDRGDYFVSRLRKKTSYKIIQTLVDGAFYREQIIYLGKHRSDQAAHPVRMVELLIDGSWYQYITNVLEPKQLPAPQLWTLYAQRWTIEVSFASVKRALGMAYLHPCSENGMLIQIWCTISVFQVLQDLRLEIASANGWNENEASWYNLMQRISQYAHNPSNKGPSLRRWLVDDAESNALKKRGVRKHRRDQLPDEVLEECEQIFSQADPNKPKSRKARQGKPAPRKKKSKIIVVGLS